MPRASATATAMPAAAETKLWKASWVICEKYDIVDSPAYDCQFVLVVNEAAVSNAWRSVTAGERLRIERQHVLQPEHDVGQQHRREAEEQHRGGVRGPVLVLVRVDARRAGRRSRSTGRSQRIEPSYTLTMYMPERLGQREQHAPSRRRSEASRSPSCQNFSGRSMV